MKSHSLLESFKYAIEGIKYTIKTQRNIRIHIIIGGLVIGLSLFLHISRVDFAVILIVISLVIVAELLNTSIETLLDIINKKYNEDVKHVKDIQAGAVLIFSVFSVVVGIILFWPYMYRFLHK